MFEKHSQKDVDPTSKNVSIVLNNLINVIPVQMHHVNHKLQQTIAQFSEDDEKFLEQIRGVKTVQNFQELKEKFYNFRMAIDSLNENLDKDLTTLRTFEKKLK